MSSFLRGRSYFEDLYKKKLVALKVICLLDFCYNQLYFVDFHHCYTAISCHYLSARGISPLPWRNGKQQLKWTFI